MEREKLLEKGKDWQKFHDLLVDQYQLCLALQLSYDTIEKLKREGVIPFIKVGKRVLFDLYDVKEAIKRELSFNEVA